MNELTQRVLPVLVGTFSLLAASCGASDSASTAGAPVNTVATTVLWSEDPIETEADLVDSTIPPALAAGSTNEAPVETDEGPVGTTATDLIEAPTENDSSAPGADESVPVDDGSFLFEVEVHTDGCGVFRSGEVGDDLTWVVTDQDGFQVLGRNAAGETQYRYFSPGTYTVYLETWGGEYYVPVSNEVTINC